LGIVAPVTVIYAALPTALRLRWLVLPLWTGLSAVSGRDIGSAVNNQHLTGEIDSQRGIEDDKLGSVKLQLYLHALLGRAARLCNAFLSEGGVSV
jgi:hypothetical protein